MKRLHKIVLLLMLTLVSFPMMASNGMEEYFYESGKIKVVVAVATIVLIGLFIYIFMLEKRLKKIEKKK